LVAVAVMGALAFACQSQLDWAALHVHPWLRIGALFAIIGVAGASYFAVLFALGFRPRDFKRTAK
jgi:putative peptidoglycan lipid II flippase